MPDPEDDATVESGEHSEEEAQNELEAGFSQYDTDQEKKDKEEKAGGAEAASEEEGQKKEGEEESKDEEEASTEDKAKKKGEEEEESDEKKKSPEEKKEGEEEEGQKKEGEEEEPDTALGKAEKKALERQQEEADALYWNKVERKHPGATKIAESDEFQDWLKKQPKDVITAANSDDPDDAVFVLEKYGESTGKKKPEKTTQEPKAVDLKDLGKLEFTDSSGTKKTLADFATEYGDADMLQAMAAIVKHLQPEGEPEPEDKTEYAKAEEFRAMRQELSELRFWTRITEEHPDARKMVKDDQFKEWAKKQTAGIQKLATSGDPDDAIVVLDAYVEHRAKTNADEKKGEAKNKKKAKDDLHKHSLRDKKSPKTPSEEEAADDFEAGFNDDKAVA